MEVHSAKTTVIHSKKYGHSSTTTVIAPKITAIAPKTTATASKTHSHSALKTTVTAPKKWGCSFLKSRMYNTLRKSGKQDTAVPGN